MSIQLLFRNLVITSSTLLAMPPSVIAQTEHHRNTVRFPRYNVTDLGKLADGDNAGAYDMNSVGWVAGSSNLVAGGPQHAFIWYGHGGLKDLGTLGGPACPICNSAADGPNLMNETAIGSEIYLPDPDGEDFCGYRTHLQCRGVVSRFGKLIALPNLPSGRNSDAFGINNLGQVVGFSENGVRDASCADGTPFQVFRFQAVVWEPNGDIRELPPLTSKGDTVAFAMGNNDQGQAVGSSGTCSTQGLPPFNVNGLHAVVWDRHGSPTYLGTLGDATHTMTNVATAVNNRGQVVGTSGFTDGTVHSFVWTRATGMQELEAFPGAFATIAGCCRTINDHGVIAGFAIDGSGVQAVVWVDRKIRDLNTLIPANPSLFLLSANSINNSGEIVGQACLLPACSELHAFLASPKD
jgi:probable HAF family extracellular repeat protein